MVAIEQAVREFLSQGRIAVTGVSHVPGRHGGNAVYTRLRERGYEVVPVNPTTDVAEGDPCYPDLAHVPGGVKAVVCATAPEHVEGTIWECADLGITHVWVHRGPGKGSHCPEAVVYAHEHGITLIDGGCPLMFGDTSDRAHRVMRRLLRKRVPQEV